MTNCLANHSKKVAKFGLHNVAKIPHTNHTRRLTATDPVFSKSPEGLTNIPEPKKYHVNKNLWYKQVLPYTNIIHLPIIVPTIQDNAPGIKLKI